MQAARSDIGASSAGSGASSGPPLLLTVAVDRGPAIQQLLHAPQASPPMAGPRAPSSGALALGSRAGTGVTEVTTDPTALTCVTLPASAVQAVPGPVSVLGGSGAEPKGIRGMRCLVVDDEVSNRRLCSRMLLRLECVAEPLADGDEVSDSLPPGQHQLSPNLSTPLRSFTQSFSSISPFFPPCS